MLKENPAKVLTNSPKLEYHLENLSQYISVSLYEGENQPSFLDVLGNKHTVISSGTGTIGLPGGMNSHHRFVRAAYFQRMAALNENIDDTLSTIWSIMNKFDVAYGSVRTKMDPKLYENEALRPFLTYENGNADEVMDVSIITTVSDLSNKSFQYKDFKNHNIREIGFNDFDLDGTEVKSLKMFEDGVGRTIKVKLS